MKSISAAIRFGAVVCTLALVACGELAVAPIELHSTAILNRKPSVPSLDVYSQPLQFFNPVVSGTIQRVGEGAGAGFSFRYSNVVTVGSQAVDAIVSIVQVVDIDEDDDASNGFDNLIDWLDGRTSTSNNSLNGALLTRFDVGSTPQPDDGHITLRFDFFLGGTNNPVILQNVKLNIIDVDDRQYVQGGGILSVSRRSTTEVQVRDLGGSVYRAFNVDNEGSDTDDEDYWVEFSYAPTSSIVLELGAKESGSALYQLEFQPATWSGSTLNTVFSGTYWYGNGVDPLSSIFALKTEICGIANGAPIDGPYLQWVLTTKNATEADISINGTSRREMTRTSRGSFRYIQTFSSSFSQPVIAYATHNGTGGNLVISHGCTSDDGGGDPTGLTIQFRPVETDQEVWYCRDAVQSTVCQAYGPGRVLDWTTFNTAGGVLEEYNIPLATLNAENTTGFFNVSVMAPDTPPAGSKIGPGEGITCLQRSDPAVVGTVNGFLSNDWTGSNPRAYWYTGCSLNSGVTHAYFYAYHVATP